jgi:hypothetical protein
VKRRFVNIKPWIVLQYRCFGSLCHGVTLTFKGLGDLKMRSKSLGGSPVFRDMLSLREGFATKTVNSLILRILWSDLLGSEA